MTNPDPSQPQPHPTSPGPPVTPLPGPAGGGTVHADRATQVGAEPSLGSGAADGAEGGSRDLRSQAGRAALLAGAVAVGTRLARTAVRRGQHVVAERRHRAGTKVGAGSEHRPLAVTVHASPDAVAAHSALDGLRALAGLEVRTSAAPGDRGTEVRVVPGDGARWSDTDIGEVRAMLREAKSRIETGTVVEAARPGGVRETALNAQLIDLTERAREEGRL
ncbi:hypothetical protein [Aquipuribacter sp. SD81]|uniref:hypothetical protein n=1 Tax=Aquipuribacter sp. SD81 TaxID=3127703 RepID=UPI0030195228